MSQEFRIVYEEREPVEPQKVRIVYEEREPVERRVLRVARCPSGCKCARCKIATL